MERAGSYRIYYSFAFNSPPNEVGEVGNFFSSWKWLSRLLSNLGTSKRSSSWIQTPDTPGPVKHPQIPSWTLTSLGYWGGSWDKDIDTRFLLEDHLSKCIQLFFKFTMKEKARKEGQRKEKDWLPINESLITNVKYVIFRWKRLRQCAVRTKSYTTSLEHIVGFITRRKVMSMMYLWQRAFGCHRN